MIYAVVDQRMSPSVLRGLEGFAHQIIPLPPHPSLALPVSSHPDMLMWQYRDKIVTYSDYLPIAKDVFRKLEGIGYSIITTDEPPSEQYPHDVRLNCAAVGQTVIGNKRHMSVKIKELAKNILHTNQGYAKCSTVCVSQNAIITADPSVYKSAVAGGLDALKITEGHVRLDGYDTGFIGGATGVTDNEVLFCGDISLHPDATSIRDFCLKHGKRAVSLSNEPLYDYGTIMFFTK